VPLVCGSARAHTGTGDQPADVRPGLGWTDAADVGNPLSWIRAPPHIRGQGAPGAGPPCRRPGNPAGGFTGSTRHLERDRDSRSNQQAKPPGSRSAAWAGGSSL